MLHRILFMLTIRKEDRLSLRNTLDVCINPFDNEYHPDGALMNKLLTLMLMPLLLDNRQWKTSRVVGQEHSMILYAN